MRAPASVDGDQLSDYHFANAGAGFFAATICEGASQRLDMSHTAGTVTDNFSVRGGRIYFDMKNNMSLESYAAQNFVHHNLIIEPASGPFSTINMSFQFSVPNPYASQRGR